MGPWLCEFTGPCYRRRVPVEPEPEQLDFDPIDLDPLNREE
jgi:hypothetical protein